MPVLLVDIEAIGRNSETVARMLRAQGLDLVGVTKGCLGEPRVGAAMIAAGAVALADTRDANLRRLRASLPGVELHRIQLPSLGTGLRSGRRDLCVVGARECRLWPEAGEFRLIESERGDAAARDRGSERGCPLGAAGGRGTRRGRRTQTASLQGSRPTMPASTGHRSRIRQSVATVALAAVGLRAAGIDCPSGLRGAIPVFWPSSRGVRRCRRR